MTTAVAGREALPSQAEVMAQAGSENFPVASLILAKEERRHLMAIYGFARLVDDVGDEVNADRASLLDHLETELDGIYNGSHPPQHPIMTTLAETIDVCNLPADPFKRLIEANRWDQQVMRYDTFEQLLDYCRLSATPVGELVLHVFNAATPERIAQSDLICSALQIIEHLQDLAEDYARGRIYLPQEDLAHFHCREEQLAAPLNHASTRAVISLEAERAHAMLAQGAPLATTLEPRQRAAVAGFVAGGRAALKALDRAAKAKRPAPKQLLFAAQLPQAALGR